MTQGANEKQASDPQALTIAGREFVMTGSELTAAQELFMQGQLRAAGVMGILADPKAALATHGEEILTALLLSGRDVWVIAAMLVEVGKRWRREDAVANAEAFADATDRDSKLALQTILFGCVTGFFGPKGKSLPTSPNCLPAPGAEDAAAAKDGANAAQETLANSAS